MVLKHDSINYVNQFHKLFNKTKDNDFDSEYQFTLRILGKKKSAKNLPDAGSWKRLLEVNVTEVNYSRWDRGKKKEEWCSVFFFRWTSFFSRSEQLYYSERKKQNKTKQSRTSRGNQRPLHIRALLVLAAGSISSGGSSDSRPKGSVTRNSEWFRVSLLPGESSSAWPVWVLWWVGIWEYMSFSLWWLWKQM